VLGTGASPEIISTLKAGGVKVLPFESETGESVHSKYLLIEGIYSGIPGRKLIFTGSHNYSENALRDNDETLLKVDDAPIFDAFIANFSALKSAAAPGCYVADGYKKDFLLHGASLDVFRGTNGEPVFNGNMYTCNDGELTLGMSNGTSISAQPFECQQSGSNDTCQTTASCPATQTIMGAVAACNLEYGTVSAAQLASVPSDKMKVVKASDVISDGSCFVGANTLSTGELAITGLEGLASTTVGCKEHDVNGGDCHVRGLLYCR
jgi:hypothetical protein